MSYGLELYSVGWLTASAQIVIIAALFVIATAIYYQEYKTTGKISKHYPLRISLLFAPIYEEIIFRGFILFGLAHIYPVATAVIISSILFGIWHLKNIFFLPRGELIYQMVYAGIIFGPIMAIITLWSGTLWPAVILHYGNNLIAPYSKKSTSRK